MKEEHFVSNENSNL